MFMSIHLNLNNVINELFLSMPILSVQNLLGPVGWALSIVSYTVTNAIDISK